MPALVYVYAISDFTLPAFEACMSYRPARVVLIASDEFMKIEKDQARRLKVLLEEKLPSGSSSVEILSKERTHESLNGDDICANAQWLQRHLVPLLTQCAQDGLLCVANLTGGTKAMTLALSNCYPWHRLDYQAFKKPVQNVSMLSAAEQSKRFISLDLASSTQWYNASPLDIARLQNWQARQEQANPLRQSAGAVALAQNIWQAQNDNDPALSALFAGFERIWVHERDQHPQAQVTLPWADFFPAALQEMDTHTLDAVQQWVQTLSTVQATQAVQTGGGAALLHANAQTITLPGNRAKRAGKNLRDWISGDWLEQLGQHWLLEAGVPATAIACNIAGSPDDDRNSNSLREADLLVHHEHTTSLIEIKAGMPPGKVAGELENQLSSLGERFGKNRKALLLGPHLLQRLKKEHKAQAFWFRCQANGVTLLLLPQHLRDFVKGKNPWATPQPEGNAVPQMFQ